MLTPAFAAVMARYNRDMNRQIYAVCASVPDEERRRDRGAFFKSIHGTLNHLLWGDALWLARFEGRPLPSGGPATEVHASFDELRAARERLDEAIAAWAERLDAGWLAAPFRFYSVSYKRERVLPAWVLVAQLFNHQAHHRGQLTALLSQRGLDYGVTDLPFSPIADELERGLEGRP
jgi:uncharacterized damage-inducible protein DinB